MTVLDDAPETVEVSFEQASYTVDEGATTSIQVILSEDPEREVVVSISSTGLGGATSTDYSVVPGSVTFVSGETEEEIVFTANADGIDDSGESVRLTFGVLPGGVLPGATATTTVDIIDDDDDQDIVRVTLILTSSTINESGAGNVSTLSATLSAASTATTTVTVAVAPSSAATLSGTTLTIPEGQSNGTGTLTITAVDNITYTGDREVTVSGTAVNSAGVTQPENVVLTIAEDDDRPVRVSFEQGSYTVPEGSDVTVTVALNEPPERRVTVPIDTTGQNGVSDSDYSGVPDSVTFESVDTEKSFTFTAIDDDVDDDGESVKLTFGSLPPGVSGGATRETIVTISDNDEPADSDSPIRMPMVTLKVTPSVIEEQGGVTSKRRHGDGVPGQAIRRRYHGDHLH